MGADHLAGELPTGPDSWEPEESAGRQFTSVDRKLPTEGDDGRALDRTHSKGPADSPALLSLWSWGMGIDEVQTVMMLPFMPLG
jgi:hypothetical protein